MGTPNNLFVGSFGAYYDNTNPPALGQSWTDAGFTEGGIELNTGAETPDQMVDQTNVAVARFLESLQPKIAFGLAEPTVTNMVQFIPGGQSSTGFVIGIPAGSPLQKFAFRAYKANPSANFASATIYMPRCVPTGNAKLPLRKGSASIVPVEIQALLPDPTANDHVSNGGFASDTVWTKGTGWTIAAGVATSGNATGTLSEAITFIQGVRYTLVFTISNYADGTITPSINGTAGTIRSANGTYTETIIAGPSGGLVFTPATAPSLDIDNVSCYPADAMSVVLIPA